MCSRGLYSTGRYKLGERDIKQVQDRLIQEDLKLMKTIYCTHSIWDIMCTFFCKKIMITWKVRQGVKYWVKKFIGIKFASCSSVGWFENQGWIICGIVYAYLPWAENLFSANKCVQRLCQEITNLIVMIYKVWYKIR